MRTVLPELLTTPGPIIADGAMGSMLYAQGLAQGEMPELWNVEQPDVVRQIHRGYIQAGAQIILTNSLGGNRLRLEMHDLGTSVSELNLAAARLACSEAEAVTQPVVVSGSMGSTGQLLAPLGTLSFEEAVSIFEEQARALAEGGVAVFWLETISDLEEVRAAIAGCRNAAPELPVVATLTFDSGGRTMMGTTPEKALEALHEWGVLALGGNCGNGPDEIEGVIAKMHVANADVTLVAKANAGLPHMENGETVYDATPEIMAAYAHRVHALGARIIGACCGSTPDHIRAMARALAS